MSFSLLALSLTTTFTKVGAIAAFAALLGIAVLSLLVFSQAREIKRLREWAGRAPERAADVEQKVSEAASARAQQQTPVPSSVRPVPRAQPIHARPAAATGPATRVVGEPVPAAPGQVPLPASAQPVTAAGTPVTPAAGTSAPTQAPAQSTPPGQPAPTPVAPATAAGATQAAQPTQTPAVPTPPGPKPIPWQQQPGTTDAKPATPEGSPPAAPASNGTPAHTPAPATAAAVGSTAPSAARAPTPPAGSTQTAGVTPPVSPAAPRRPTPPSQEVVAKRVQARSGVTGAPVSRERSTAEPQATARSSSGRSRDNGGGFSRRSIGLLVAGIAVVIVLAVVLLGKGGSSPTKSSGGKAAQVTTGSTVTKTHHKAKASPKAANPADTTVSVLNGTEQTGLARRVSTSLQQKGYSQATAQFGNPPGTHEVTVVEYASGHQTDAEGVAQALSVSHVQPMEQAVATLAGSARVVVIVGADEATTVP